MWRSSICQQKIDITLKYTDEASGTKGKMERKYRDYDFKLKNTASSCVSYYAPPSKMGGHIILIHDISIFNWSYSLLCSQQRTNFVREIFKEPKVCSFNHIQEVGELQQIPTAPASLAGDPQYRGRS